jgi:hypothetical protein
MPDSVKTEDAILLALFRLGSCGLVIYATQEWVWWVVTLVLVQSLTWMMCKEMSMYGLIELLISEEKLGISRSAPPPKPKKSNHLQELEEFDRQLAAGVPKFIEHGPEFFENLPPATVEARARLPWDGV